VPPTKKAFVLMPFQNPYNGYYRDIFKPALEEASYQVSRADDVFSARPIMLDIQDSIRAADLLLCDMSGRNPNVFYELGLAHAIGKPTILVSSTEQDIPFDLRHVRVILYDCHQAGWEKSLKEKIFNTAQEVSSASVIWPPPLIADKNPFAIIDDSMNGYMKRCIDIESAATKRRYAVFKHLPSFVRKSPMTVSDSISIRRNWDTTGQVEYCELTNERRRTVQKMLVDGSSDLVIREIYERPIIEHWVRTGEMFPGEGSSPLAERKERLAGLLHILRHSSPHKYNIRVTSGALHFPFVICDDHVVIDVGRQVRKSYTVGISGLFCSDPSTVQSYADFFQGIWESIDLPSDSERIKIMDWLEDLLSELEKEQPEDDPERVLFDLYTLSFPQHLRLSWTREFKEFPSLNAYLSTRFTGTPHLAAYSSELAKYRGHTAPTAKMAPLLSYLSDIHWENPKRILDFGCGTGQEPVFLLNAFCTIQCIHAIDEDLEARRQTAQAVLSNRDKVMISADLGQIEALPQSCDLAVLVDVLHHAKRHDQDIILANVASAMRTGALLYLYEDSWDEAQSTSTSNESWCALSLLHKRFAKLSRDQKIRLYLLNEYWSNEWCYERHINVSDESYRSKQEWLQLFESTGGWKVVASGQTEISANRLHGVPSVWIIAERR
jgi:SAM-dependent methyltransferase